MVRKSDRDDAAILAGDSHVPDIHNEEFDDEVTASVSEAAVDVVSIVNDDAPVEDLGTDSSKGPDDAAADQPTEDDVLEPGFLLRDRFRIVELVHSGGMGHVYKARDRRRHRHGSDQVHVAIKMMRRSVAPEFESRLVLEREAVKTQHLSHPNIVNVYDFDQHDDQFYIVMEWLEGESVNALLRRTTGQPLAPQYAWRVIQGIASGVQHAHSNNVVHADINPSNIFITDTQEIKLLDFGVSRYGGHKEEATDHHFAWATRTYASPEVLSGLPPTFEDDIFSLGCVAYRLLSGRHPFGGWTSTEAQEGGVTLQPIAGLAETHWRTLKRALSYEHSDRPNTANAFLGDQRAAAGFVDSVRRLRPAQWLAVASVAAIALLAGFWWLSQGALQNESTAIDQTTSLADESNLDAEGTIEPSELDELLNSATQAMDEERFLTPEDNNARVLYRNVLVLDPANSVALTGLRKISDMYVQRANTALHTGVPARAIEALDVAAETDPENPAIAIVNELLLAQGNAQLADARLAAAEGDAERATELLANAERYARVDMNAINAVRQQIEQGEQDRLLDRLVAAADAHVAAGRLIAPDGDNAHALLVEALDDHGTDSRLKASMERLAERLLTRAAFATAADQFSAATELLDAVDELGVLPLQVTAARTSLQRAANESLDATIAASAQPAPAESAAQPAPLGGDSEQPSSLTSLRASTSIATGPENAALEDSGTIVRNEPSKTQNISLSDLAIEKYVAPRFPSRARRQGQTGLVELAFSVNTDGTTDQIEILHAEPSRVFVSSAKSAVKEWRFAQRDDVVKAQVTLRFELEP